MKVLTLNTHSLQEERYEEKLDIFVEYVCRERPDLIAMQEVNQSAEAMEAGDCKCLGKVCLPECEMPVRCDNHALQVVRRLRRAGIVCSWAWLPIKLGYGRYDEGAAVISLNGRITDTDVCVISGVDDYQNWRTRKALGVCIENRDEWFYTVHMGWWEDEKEPFAGQWRILNGHLTPLRRKNRVWLLGDFNSPAEIRNQGYDLIAKDGWYDSYILAEEKDEGKTVLGVIDGWRERLGTSASAQGMRIDQIWCSEEADVKRSRVMFSGLSEPVVSDHFGVWAEIRDQIVSGTGR